MKLTLILRTLIVAAWLVPLLHTGRDARAGLLVLLVLGVWTAPLVRDRARRRPRAVGGAVPSR